jgi:hypothetical protein
MTPTEQFFLDLLTTGALKVENDGTVINTRTNNKIGSHNKQKNWYMVAIKNDNCQLLYIPQHRLIWMAHNGPIPEGMLVVPHDKNFLNLKIENYYLRARCQKKLREALAIPKPPKPVIIKPVKLAKVKPVLMTRVQVREHCPHTRLTLDLVSDFRRRYAAGSSIRLLAIEIKCNSSTVAKAVTGETWHDCPVPPVALRPKPPKKQKVEIPKIAKPVKPMVVKPSVVKKVISPPTVAPKRYADPRPDIPKQRAAPRVYPGRLCMLWGIND